MKAKEKAKELIDKMVEAVSNHDCYGSEYLVAKDTALVAADEIMQYAKQHGFIGLLEWHQEVKQEIEKL
jgi:hypothetical protein